MLMGIEQIKLSKSVEELKSDVDFAALVMLIKKHC